MPDLFISYLARVLSSASLARAVLWTLEPDLDENVFDPRRFSYRELHQAVVEAAASE
jgi:hypothetical protein